MHTGFDISGPVTKDDLLEAFVKAYYSRGESFNNFDGLTDYIIMSKALRLIRLYPDCDAIEILRRFVRFGIVSDKEPGPPPKTSRHYIEIPKNPKIMRYSDSIKENYGA